MTPYDLDYLISICEALQLDFLMTHDELQEEMKDEETNRLLHSWGGVIPVSPEDNEEESLSPYNDISELPTLPKRINRSSYAWEERRDETFGRTFGSYVWGEESTNGQRLGFSAQFCASVWRMSMRHVWIRSLQRQYLFDFFWGCPPSTVCCNSHCVQCL